MYRPEPEILRAWVPPVPAVVEKIEVQAVPSGEAWIWKALPYAVSQYSTTWVIEAVAPRSTCSHCGSLNALDQRVLRLPSTAAEAGYEALSMEDAVAGWSRDSKVGAAAAGWAVVARTTAPKDSTATTATTAPGPERQHAPKRAIGPP